MTAAMDMQDQEGHGQGLNLAEQIRRIANGRTTIDVAQFQFIGLDEIRQRYGEKWKERRDKVVHVAREFINRRMTPEDMMIPGADGFLLVFGSRSGIVADAAAQSISTELNTFFLGAADMDDDVRFFAYHRSMSVDDFAEAFGDLIAESRQMAQSAARVRTAPGEIPMGFTPVWDAGRGALTTYFVTPLDAETGHPLVWDHTHRHHTEMDELKLKASEEAMLALFATGKKALVGVALHVSSLNNQQSLERLLAVMSKFDRKLAGLRVVRISGVEPGFPRIYLEDIMRTLRPRLPNIAVGFNWTEPDIGSIMKLKPAAIGFSLQPGSLGSRAPRADLFARVHAAAELARHHGVPVGVEGDIAPEDARRFMSDGVQHLASLRIWPVLPALPPAQIWPRSKLDQAVACDTAA